MYKARILKDTNQFGLPEYC